MQANARDRYRRHAGHRQGFTLIELLVVIAIIMILAALMMPAISKAKRSAQRNLARQEVRSIAAAWQRYLSDYRSPRQLASGEDGLPADLAELERTGIEIDDVMAALLTAQSTRYNRNQVRYMEFKKYDDEGAPANPWWDSNRAAQTHDGHVTHRYHVKFDANLDGAIDADDGASPPDSRVPLTVIVWTYDLNVDDPSDVRYVVGSWN